MHTEGMGEQKASKPEFFLSNKHTNQTNKHTLTQRHIDYEPMSHKINYFTRIQAVILLPDTKWIDRFLL